MEVDKEKWYFQSWMVPHHVRLDRRGESWELVFFCGSVPISAEWGEKLAVAADKENTRLDMKFRRSLRFRWIRFWFLRREKKRGINEKIKAK